MHTRLQRTRSGRWHALRWAMVPAASLGLAVLAAGTPAAQMAPRLAIGTPGGAAPACADPAKALGVSRTVEIDTASGPKFGRQQYLDHDFLKDGEVVLTFDDGPLRPYTRPVLDALDAYCTKATFFMVGKMALSDPAMVQMVARRGHTVGTHTWSHANLGTLSQAQAKEEIELGFSAVQKALGRPIAPFFRFPYLSAPKSAIGHVQARQGGVFSIDIDSADFRTRSGDVMVNTVLGMLTSRRKGILLFHDIQPSTAAGIRKLLAELKSRGFKVVHMVPKSQLVTLAEFDARVGGEHKRRQAVAAANPLATRAMTWSMWTTEVKPATAAPRAPMAPLPRVPMALPPPPPPAAAMAPPPLPRAPRPPRAEETDWRRSVFER